MIEINERFEVAASPTDVYAVLADPNAVVECVPGAELGELHEDGSFDAGILIKFSALRIAFKGKVSLELDKENHRGTMKARGKDGQGGTRFECEATFEVTSEDGGATSVVTAKGQVDLAGKLASVIEGAANAVVKRMTGEFVAALSLRCASTSTELGPRVAPVAEAASAPSEPSTSSSEEGAVASPPPATAPAVASAAVLLLHGFGDTPNSLRAWGEALADAGAAVSIPRLPGHGARWQELNKTSAADWLQAAEESLAHLRKEHGQVFVMGISLGATLGLRLAELHPTEVSGVIAVNPVAVGLLGAPKLLGVVRHLRRAKRGLGADLKRTGVAHVGFDRIPLNAAFELRKLAAETTRDLAKITAPALLVSSTVDHVVAPSDGDLVWSALTTVDRRRATAADSYHLVPLDNDAATLFADSVAFVQTHTLVESS